jgi:hypothetical protein
MEAVMVIVVIAVAAILWLLMGSKPAGAGVISNPGDFDSVTASQLGGAVNGDVSIGDDWTATFINGTGDWSDAYKSKATIDDFLSPLQPNTAAKPWDGLYR